MVGALEEATGAMVVVDPTGEEEDRTEAVGIGREVGHQEGVDPTGAAVDMEEVEVDMEEEVATLDGVKRNL